MRVNLVRWMGEPRLVEKRWSRTLEAEIAKKWKVERLYRFRSETRKKIFSIDTPPPYPSGRPWSVGAAAHYSQIDMIARTARMQGYEVYFPIGIDRNGLPVELYTERLHKIDIHETPREKFIELCRYSLDDLEAEMINTMKTMGLSGDFDHYYRTDSEEYRRLTQATFIQLWKEGLIYEDTRPNNYCVDCGTTIADADITYVELPTTLFYIRFGIKERQEAVTVATTRPEFLCSCRAILVHPDDSRYTNLHGLHCIVPIYGREVPIIPNTAAKQEFGTGVVMICSYGDSSDVRLFRELKLEEIVAIDNKGKMTDAAGKYSGLPIEEARKEIARDLEEQGLIQKKEDIMHRTPICDRCRTPVEIVPMKEFYLKQMEFLPSIRKIAERMVFHPEAHRQILYNWIDSVAIDWPISRRRIYGTEIPIWYCKSCGKPNIPEPGPYHRPWSSPPPFRVCQHCGADRGFIGEERTFDTWFDSSISPLFISGYMRSEKLYRKTYPVTIRPQAKDIVRTWLYYTILRCYQLTGKPAFKHAWIMGYGVDEAGERMSKSKGNVVDPIPLLEKYGADTFRFWNAAEASLGSDFRCSEQRIAGTSKFLTKLWNLSRFISSFPKPMKAHLTASDKWIVSELEMLRRRCLKGYEDFNFFIPSNEIREFVWNLFAPHYVEMAKARAYNSNHEFSNEDQRAAWFTLHHCLRSLLVLLAPICPYITDHLWRSIYSSRSIHTERFPRPSRRIIGRLDELTACLKEFNSTIWKYKKDNSMALNQPIARVYASKKLRSMARDLKAMHRIEDLRLGVPSGAEKILAKHGETYVTL
jgi:valyl-tRNA synthetase